ncbi:MAG: hypothetical protein IJ586_07065, partial [Alloprevotella sp.]|nr:hypothetical protein [Alloprevotella sp.]
ESDGQFAIRYYDGANRAQNGASGSWKNFDAGSVIPAGTGFILQTSIRGKTTFRSLNNASKQYALSTLPFTKALQEGDSDVPANKGWNLVGNPWQCYYNIHKLNFTAPITVWNGSGYTAYSVIRRRLRPPAPASLLRAMPRRGDEHRLPHRGPAALQHHREPKCYTSLARNVRHAHPSRHRTDIG